MIIRFRLTLIRGDEVVAMRTYPIEAGPGHSAVFAMDVATAKFVRGLTYTRLMLGDELKSEIMRDDFYRWSQNPILWVNS